MSYHTLKAIIENALDGLADQTYGGEVDIELDVNGMKSISHDATFLTVEKGADSLDLVMFPHVPDTEREQMPRADIYSQMTALAMEICTLTPDADDEEDRALSARISSIIQQFEDLAETIRVAIVS